MLNVKNILLVKKAAVYKNTHTILILCQNDPDLYVSEIVSLIKKKFKFFLLHGWLLGGHICLKIFQSPVPMAKPYF